MRLSRRHAALALPALLAGFAAGAAEGAGATLLVGAQPGSAADAWARGFAPFLERHWPGTAVAVRNHPGEGGLAAARLLADSAPEAGLIGAIATPLLLARLVEAGEAALPGRLLFLATVAEEPTVLAAHPAAAEDLAALRALGPAATLGTPPPGSAAQLAALAFSRAATPALHLLPLPNAAAARQAVLAGHIPCAMLPATEAVAALREGRLAGLAVAQAERSPLLPDIPTFAEAASLPLAMAAQRGFALPAAAAGAGAGGAARLAALQAALRAAAADPEFAALAEARGFQPRFLGYPAWDEALRRQAAELREGWRNDPWVPRGD